MKLKIYKQTKDDKEELIVKIIDDKGEKDFDYIELIEFLYYEKDADIDFEYTQNVTAEEKEKIQKVFNEIKSEIISKEKSE